MLFSVTEIETHLRCERRWGLSSENYDNLEPIMNAPHLALGTLVQAALSEWTEAPDIDPVEAYQKLYVGHIERVSKLYEVHHGFPVSDQELDPLYEDILLGEKMVTNYRDFYHIPLPPEYTVIRTEQRAIVDIPNTLHIECNNCHWIPSHYEPGFTNYSTQPCKSCGMIGTISAQNHQLRGTFDTFLQDSHSKLWILERKTYNQRPKPDILARNHQQLSYNWIARQILTQSDNDPNAVAGCLYDGLWKRDVEGGRSGKRSYDDLFYRELFPRSQAELDEFESQLPTIATRMAASKQMPITALTINRTWQGCWDCKLERLCTAMSLDEDVEYVRSEYYAKRNAYSNEVEDD